MRRLHFILCLVGLLAACGGQSVEALNPRDATLPKETRLWVADAEDGVIVARARRDLIRKHLEDINEDADRLRSIEWDGGKGANMGHAAATLSEARILLAETELEQAERSVDLAVAKNDLANAERAMLHDLAQYDLEPLKAKAEELRQEVGKLRAAVDTGRKALDKATERWWAAYARYVASGGKTNKYWALQGAS